MKNKTKHFGFKPASVGYAYSSIADRDRFEKLELQLLACFKSFGDGVIDGWDVVCKKNKILISPGAGIMDSFLIESPFSIVRNEQKGIVEREISTDNDEYGKEFVPKTMEIEIQQDGEYYLYAQRKSGPKYPKLEDYKINEEIPNPKDFKNVVVFKKAEKEYNDKITEINRNYCWNSNRENYFTEAKFVLRSNAEKGILLASVSKKDGKISIDLSGRKEISDFREKILKELNISLCGHKHKSVSNKIRLDRDVSGKVNSEHLESINASSFVSGNFTKDVLPNFTHKDFSTYSHLGIEKQIYDCTYGMPKDFLDTIFNYSFQAISILSSMNLHNTPPTLLNTIDLRIAEIVDFEKTNVANSCGVDSYFRNDALYIPRGKTYRIFFKEISIEKDILSLFVYHDGDRETCIDKWNFNGNVICGFSNSFVSLGEGNVCFMAEIEALEITIISYLKVMYN